MRTYHPFILVAEEPIQKAGYFTNKHAQPGANWIQNNGISKAYVKTVDSSSQKTTAHLPFPLPTVYTQSAHLSTHPSIQPIYPSKPLSISVRHCVPNTSSVTHHTSGGL